MLAHSAIVHGWAEENNTTLCRWIKNESFHERTFKLLKKCFMSEFHAMFVCWLICPQQRSLASGRPVCLVMCMDTGAAPRGFWKPIKRALSQLMGFNEKINLKQTLPARPMLFYFLLILQSASSSDGSGTVMSHVFDYAHFHHVKLFNKKYCICHFLMFSYQSQYWVDCLIVL